MNKENNTQEKRYLSQETIKKLVLEYENLPVHGGGLSAVGTTEGGYIQNSSEVVNQSEPKQPSNP